MADKYRNHPQGQNQGRNNQNKGQSRSGSQASNYNQHEDKRRDDSGNGGYSSMGTDLGNQGGGYENDLNTGYRSDYDSPYSSKMDNRNRRDPDERLDWGNSYGNVPEQWRNDNQNSRHGNDDWKYEQGDYGKTKSQNRPSHDYTPSSHYGPENLQGVHHRDDRGGWDSNKNETATRMGEQDADQRRSQNMQFTGQYRGKGPKGYARSDDRIREDVCDRMCDDDFLDASDIEVQVMNNEVILNGTVDSREAKRRAVDIAESISGVQNVQNRLRVSHSEGGATNR